VLEGSIIGSNSVVGFDGYVDQDLVYPPTPGRGGGISVEQGKATLLDSTIAGNTATGGRGEPAYAGGDASGAGVHVVNGDVRIERCALTLNTVRGAAGGDDFGMGDFPTPGGKALGGGICIERGKVVLADSIIRFNTSSGGVGGSSYRRGERGGDAYGGGIRQETGVLEITGTTLNANLCMGGEGSFCDGGAGGDGAHAGGGGISMASGIASLLNSTISDNDAAGGEGGSGRTDPNRFLFGWAGYGGQGIGGGMFSDRGNVRLTNCTVVLNRARGGFAGFTDGIYEPSRAGSGQGGGMAQQDATMSLRATIIASNQADDGPDGLGTFASQGSNLVGTESGMTLSGGGPADLKNIDPRLGALRDYGGPVPTHALLTASPAIDAVPSTGTPPADQRGILRPQGLGVDIGAFERITELLGSGPQITGLSTSRTVLADTDVLLSVEVSGIPPYSYCWEHNGRPIANATNATLDLQRVQPADGGSYQVRISGVEGSVNSSEIILEVRPFFVDPTFKWAHGSKGYGSHYAYGMAVASDGGVYVAAPFTGRLELGDIVFTNSSAGAGLCVLNYGPEGELRWARRGGGTGYASFAWRGAAGSDAAGNVYLTGWFQERLDFAGRSVTSAGATDVFVVKLSPSGTTIWLRGEGGSGYESPSSIAVDRSGNCVITGYYYTNSVFGTQPIHGFGESDVFVAKYNASGVLQWVQQAGGPDSDRGGYATIDESGNCYVSGTFNGTATFGPGVTLSTAIENAPFLASYDSDGRLRWVMPVAAGAVAADRHGHLYVAQRLDVAKYDSDGNLLWQQPVCATDQNAWSGVLGMAVDAEGACYVTGYSHSQILSPSTAKGGRLPSFGLADVLVAKIGGDGATRWVTSAGGKRDDYGDRIAVNDVGSVFMCGTFQQHVTLGANTLHGAPWSSGHSIFIGNLEIEPVLALDRAVTLSDRRFAVLHLDGERDARYAIETSDDLGAWSTLVEVTNSAGRTELTDGPDTANTRFYRARLIEGVKTR
jgi:hypothetical protein